MVVMVKFILTVPHATCPHPYIPDHPCDIRATEFAETLSKAITCGRTELHIGDVSRDVCDLNRIECRHYPFRKRVAESITPDTIVLDIHSFPHPSVYSPNTFFILGKSEMVDKIRKKVEKEGYLVGSAYPAKYNDILAQAEELKAKDALILEIAEDVKRNDIERISKAVADAICGP